MRRALNCWLRLRRHEWGAWVQGVWRVIDIATGDTVGYVDRRYCRRCRASRDRTQRVVTRSR